MADLLSLAGKRALVTGAGVGIGAAIAVRLAELGADLELIDRTVEQLSETHTAAQRYGHEVTLHGCDLADKKAIDALWQTLAARPPEILVNNAGIYPLGAFVRMSEATYREVMATNLDAVVWMCQHFLRAQAARGGVIINIASIEAVLPFRDDLAAYDASKAGVLALTRALAKEHGPQGVRVNAVLPGGIVTPGTKQIAAGIWRLKLGRLSSGYDFGRRLPLKRFGQPDEVARVVAVLASEVAAYMQGAVIPVDGGFLSA